MTKPIPSQSPFGRHLQALRLKAGVSQTEAAKAVGVSQHSIHRCEKVGVVTGREMAVALAKLYGVSLDELLDANQVNGKQTRLTGRLADLFKRAADLPRHRREALTDNIAALVDNAERQTKGSDKKK